MPCSRRAGTGAFVLSGLMFAGLLACSGVLDLDESGEVSVVADVVGDTTVMLTVRNHSSDEVKWTLECGDGREQRVGSWWLGALPDLCAYLDLFRLVQDTIEPGGEHTRAALVEDPEHWEGGTYRFKLLLYDDDGLLPDEARTSNALETGN